MVFYNTKPIALFLLVGCVLNGCALLSEEDPAPAEREQDKGKIEQSAIPSFVKWGLGVLGIGLIGAGTTKAVWHGIKQRWRANHPFEAENQDLQHAIKAFYKQNQQEWADYLAGKPGLEIFPVYDDNGNLTNLDKLVLILPLYDESVLEEIKERKDKAHTVFEKQALDLKFQFGLKDQAKALLYRQYFLHTIQVGEFAQKAKTHKRQVFMGKQEIIPGLWVGEQNALAGVASAGFTRVLSAHWSGEIEMGETDLSKYDCNKIETLVHADDLKMCTEKKGDLWKFFLVPDSGAAFDLWMEQVPGEPDKTYLETFFEMMDQARQDKKSMLIHCQEGQSRSASLVLAYMISRLDVGLDEALLYAKGKRLGIQPKPSLYAQLKRFEAMHNANTAPAQWHATWHKERLKRAAWHEENRNLERELKEPIPPAVFQFDLLYEIGDIDYEFVADAYYDNKPSSLEQFKRLIPGNPPSPRRLLMAEWFWKRMHTNYHQIIPHVYVGNKTALLEDLATNPNLFQVVAEIYPLDRFGTDQGRVEALFTNHPEIKRIVVEADDHLDAFPLLLAALPDLFKTIDETRLNGKDVLIHCGQGESRSASVVIAYLMNRFGLSREQAYDYVRSKRSIVTYNPNNPDFNLMIKASEDENNQRLIMAIPKPPYWQE